MTSRVTEKWSSQSTKSLTGSTADTSGFACKTCAWKGECNNGILLTKRIQDCLMHGHKSPLTQTLSRTKVGL